MMKRFLLLSPALVILCLFTGLISPAAAIAKEKGRLFEDTIIHQDMIWSGNIAIRGVFVVGRGATLTIQPGTTVRFHRIDTNNDGIGDAEIRVLGRIVAAGTKNRNITFQSAEKKPSQKDWSYVLIFASAQKNSLQYCLFRDAFTGLQVHFSTAMVSDSVFTNNNEGLRFGRAKIKISHNTITNNNLGVRFTRMEGPVEITGNSISRNRIGIFLAPSSQNIVDFSEPGRTGKPWNDGHLVIRDNNIYANAEYDLNLGARQKWDLAIEGNWWGTPEPQAISNNIFDILRDPKLGRAVFEPVLTARVPNAGPR